MYNDYDTLRCRAVAALSDARKGLEDEISLYPTPISGCDAQFNYLLAERCRLSDALDALAKEVFVPTPRTPHPSAGIESR